MLHLLKLISCSITHEPHFFQNTKLKCAVHSLPAIFVHFDWWSSSSSSSEKSSGLPLLLNFALADELGEKSYRPALGGGGLEEANMLLKRHDTARLESQF
jgi:hypothetical protein